MYKKLFCFYFILLGCVFTAYSSTKDTLLIFNNDKVILRVDQGLYIFHDQTKSLKIDDVVKKKYHLLKKSIPNLGITSDKIWIRFTVKNLTKSSQLMLEVAQPSIDSISLFQEETRGEFKETHLGKYKKFKERPINDPAYIFPIDIQPNAFKTFYISISSTDQIQLPMTLGTLYNVLITDNNKDILFGIYAGIIVIMILYNLFISFTVKDSSYIYYIIYILFVGLTQATFQGYAFKYLWPNSPWMAINSSFLIPFLSGITTAEFLKRFLQTKNITPNLHKGINLFILLYVIALLISFLGYRLFSIQMLQILALLGSIYFLYIAAVITRMGSRPALFFLIAYSIFLFCVVIFVLRNFNIVKYNLLTSYILEIGSAIQIMLLSFALADKINAYRKEKEESQANAFRILIENEKLVREQNIMLETKVKERTETLEQTNENLNQVLINLKEAQSQLVDAEKMAGLGQLTAGIAHEINNPINFVTSNIKPLELDINELDEVIRMYENLDLNANLEEQLKDIDTFKKRIDINFVRNEITSLLSGIGDGARRTAEIIRSLKNFSRLDENDTKPVNLNEGLDSTLVLIKSSFHSNLETIKDYKSTRLVECMAGKINQVFMNLITNAVYAIKAKPVKNEKEFITIKTWDEDEFVKISIKDTGSGMSEEVKQKIFEPFFTTKDIGEGTGLGLSIVFSIIDKHKGHIEVLSELGEGTEFIITLPVNTPQ